MDGMRAAPASAAVCIERGIFRLIALTLPPIGGLMTPVILSKMKREKCLSAPRPALSWSVFPAALFRVFAMLVATGSLLSGVAPAPAEEATRVFRAGAARADITPPLGSMLIGLAFIPRPAKDVHDPLLARALVLDDGATRLAIVVCDNLGIAQVVCDEAKRRVTARTGLPRGHVLIAATHTHSAPTTRGAAGNTGEEFMDGYGPRVTELTEYQELVADRIAAAVEEAIARLEPARVGWGRVDVPEHVFNRRWYVRDETLRRNPFGGVDLVRMNPPGVFPELISPAGPTDPEISVLSLQTTEGKPLAVLANYSLHYVGGVPQHTITADYYGVFAQEIAALLKNEGADEGFVGIMSNGTSGDINNIDFRKPRPSRKPYEQMNYVAKSVAGSVHGVLQKMEYRDWVKLDARYHDLVMRPRKPTPGQFEYARKIMAKEKDEAPWHPQERDYAQRILLGANAPELQQVPVQAFRIGEVGIGAIPAEVLVEIGLELKGRSSFPQAFVMSLANGHYAYMAPEYQHRLGGYETWLGKGSLEIGAADRMVETILAMWRDMR